MIHVHVTEIGGPRHVKQELTTAVNLGMAVAIETDYHRRFLRRHFEPSAVRRYGYQKRTKRYQLRKARVKRHQRPLVWSGSLLRQLTGSIQISTLKRASEARGKMQGRALNLSGRANMPDMKAEVLATADDEVRQMAVTTRRVATRKLNSIRKQTTRKVT